MKRRDFLKVAGLSAAALAKQNSWLSKDIAVKEIRDNILEVGGYL